MSTKPNDDDIRDVMAVEKTRGKRPLDLKARKERAKLLRQIREALDLDTEKEFREAIRGLQLDENPKRLEDAVRIWRSFFSSRRK
jgi:hypothetical protein